METSNIEPSTSNLQPVQQPGWGRAQLPAELVKRGLLSGAEIGVQKGEYSEQMLRAGVTHLILVDLWAQQGKAYFDIANVADAEHEKNYQETQQRIKAFPADVLLLRQASVAAATLVDDGSLDFVYLDADHKLAAVRADLAAWYPKVRPGGVICGHDFMDSPNCCGSEFGVATAVTEFCRQLGVTEYCVAEGECFPNWHFFKPA